MKRRQGRLAGFGATAALCCLLLAPSSAEATAVCAFNGTTHVLSVSVNDGVTDLAADTGTIEVLHLPPAGSGFDPVACSGPTPTNTNTDRVEVTDINNTGASTVQIFGEGFAPGFSGSGSTSARPRTRSSSRSP